MNMSENGDGHHRAWPLDRAPYHLETDLPARFCDSALRLNTGASGSW